MRTSDVIVTDSGGVQEEAPSLGVPVVVMRDTTDRPEAVQAGCAILAGAEPRVVYLQITRLLDDPVAHARAAGVRDVFGDDKAPERIVKRLVLSSSVPAP